MYNRVWRFSILLFFCFLCMQFAHAQDIEIKNFVSLDNDQTAVANLRNDINGIPCGVVKVFFKDDGAEFEGNVMGDVDFTGGEYIVYLANGTKRLSIKHPDYLPTTVVFDNYGIKKIDSNKVYKLELKANNDKSKSKSVKKGLAIFNISPSNALLIIDDQPVENIGGVYTASLTYGTHYYSVRLDDFGLDNLQVKIDKNPKTLDVDLSEYYAQVNLNCADDDAEIYINNELRGLGSWNGLMAPGNVSLEVRKQGYHTLARTFKLHDNESYAADFPKMNKMTGSLSIECEPVGSEVYLNGKKVGITPWTNALPVGNYELEVRKKNYNPMLKNIVVNEDQHFLINDSLILTQMGKIIEGAEQGNMYAMCLLSELYLKGYKDAISRDSFGVFYSDGGGIAPFFYVNLDQMIKEDDRIDMDLEQFEYWEKKARSSLLNPDDLFIEGDYIISWVWDDIYEYAMETYLLNGSSKSFYWLYIGMPSSVSRNFWLAWHYYYGIGTSRDKNETIRLLGSLMSYKDVQNESTEIVLKNIGNNLAKKFNWDNKIVQYINK